MIVDCVGYLAQSLATLLVPGYQLNLAVFTFWGERLLPLWLVIKGVNVERRGIRALEAAG